MFQRWTGYFVDGAVQVLHLRLEESYGGHVRVSGVYGDHVPGCVFSHSVGEEAGLDAVVVAEDCVRGGEAGGHPAGALLVECVVFGHAGCRGHGPFQGVVLGDVFPEGVVGPYVAFGRCFLLLDAIGCELGNGPGDDGQVLRIQVVSPSGVKCLNDGAQFGGVYRASGFTVFCFLDGLQDEVEVQGAACAVGAHERWEVPPSPGDGYAVAAVGSGAPG